MIGRVAREGRAAVVASSALHHWNSNRVDEWGEAHRFHTPAGSNFLGPSKRHRISSGEGGGEGLAGLLSSPCLEAVILAGCSVTDQDLAVCSKGLRKLDLSMCKRVTEHGLLQVVANGTHQPAPGGGSQPLWGNPGDSQVFISRRMPPSPIF